MYNLRRYLLFSSLLVDIIFTNLQAAQVEKLGQGITIPSAVASYAGNMQAPAFNFEQKLKNYYPVSPSAARLIDEINYPVDYSTGAMNLSIPIYEIRTRDFVLPITLKCVTTGIKAFRNNYNRVGIGWDLEVEPMITREIHGNDDDYGYLNYDSRFNNPRQQYLLNIVKNGLDSEPDVFYFRTLTNSGKFMFKKPENETSPKYGKGLRDGVLFVICLCVIFAFRITNILFMYALPIFPQIIEDYKQYLRKDLSSHVSFSKFVRPYHVRYASLTQWMSRHGLSVEQLQYDALLEKCGTHREEVVAHLSSQLAPDPPACSLKSPGKLPYDKLLNRVELSFPDGLQVRINAASPSALYDFINRYNHLLDKQDVRIE